MKKISMVIIGIIFIGMIHTVSGQLDDKKKIETELIVTDEQKIILFGSFALIVICLFVYLARDIILRRKTPYDFTEFDSKKDKTYEKYHSDWTDDYEPIGSKNISEEENEFRITSKNSSLPDYYKILEISQNATSGEIKNQYRILAKKIHPDKNKSKKSEEIMVQINKAYEILSNEELRKKYDIYFKKN